MQEEKWTLVSTRCHINGSKPNGRAKEMQVTWEDRTMTAAG